MPRSKVEQKWSCLVKLICFIEHTLAMVFLIVGRPALRVSSSAASPRTAPTWSASDGCVGNGRDAPSGTPFSWTGSGVCWTCCGRRALSSDVEWPAGASSTCSGRQRQRRTPRMKPEAIYVPRTTSSSSSPTPTSSCARTSPTTPTGSCCLGR